MRDLGCANPLHGRGIGVSIGQYVVGRHLEGRAKVLGSWWPPARANDGHNWPVGLVDLDSDVVPAVGAGGGRKVFRRDAWGKSAAGRVKVDTRRARCLHVDVVGSERDGQACLWVRCREDPKQIVFELAPERVYVRARGGDHEERHIENDFLSRTRGHGRAERRWWGHERRRWWGRGRRWRRRRYDLDVVRQMGRRGYLGRLEYATEEWFESACELQFSQSCFDS